jgi:hypothetical protein
LAGLFLIKMATNAQPLIAAIPPPELYYYHQHKCYECLGCHELIEVPRYATLMVDGKMQRVAVMNNAENLLIWRELHELDHEKCGAFGDAAKAKDAREHRSVKRCFR